MYEVQQTPLHSTSRVPRRAHGMHPHVEIQDIALSSAERALPLLAPQHWIDVLKAILVKNTLADAGHAARHKEVIDGTHADRAVQRLLSFIGSCSSPIKNVSEVLHEICHGCGQKLSDRPPNYN